MARVQLTGTMIVDWDSFHTICAEQFGFPDFYGRNGNAWIDCLTYVDVGDGMSRFHLEPGEKLWIEVTDSESLRERLSPILEALIDWTNSVNARFLHAGAEPRLELVLL